MFILDSLMISGIRWTLQTVVTAAEAEMNDDAALRDQLLEAEMRREGGEITDAEFAALEADLLARIREIKERREGSGPLAIEAAGPVETGPDSGFQVEASVTGDFHQPAIASESIADAADPAAAQQPSHATSRAARPRGKSSSASRHANGRRPARASRRAAR